MTVAANDVALVNKPLTGIALKVISVVVFVLMSSFIKAAGQVPPGQIVFFRSFFAIFPIIIVLIWQRELFTAYKTNNPFGHFLRGLVGIVSMALVFFGLTVLPLAEAITLNYAQPLLVVVFSAIFLGEIIRVYRWSAVVAGFVGVVIIAWPNLTLISGGGMEWSQGLGVVAILVGAALSAIAQLLVRKLILTEKTSTIVLWFSINASILALFTLPFGWSALSHEQVAFLVAAGICGGIGQVLMTQCYRYADMSTIAPFEYISILLAVGIGYFFFGDVPTLYMLVGSIIVVSAGLFIIWRERRLGLKLAAARRFVNPGAS